MSFYFLFGPNNFSYALSARREGLNGPSFACLGSDPRKRCMPLNHVILEGIASITLHIVSRNLAQVLTLIR